jgi:hypothetical protein
LKVRASLDLQITNMEATAALTTDRLAALVRQKHDVLVPLHDLARKQLEAVAADDVDRLLAILATKQPLLAELQRLERALDPFRQQAPEERVWASPAERRACQQTAERANRLLAELMELERQGERALQSYRQVVAEQLQQTSGALAARQAYAAPASAERGGLDLMSET